VAETTVLQLSQPATFADPLTEVRRNGARALPSQGVEAEVAALLSCHADEFTDDGRQRPVRRGHLPEHEISSRLVGTARVACVNPLKSLERVKGIEPSSSAWKASEPYVISRLILTNRHHSAPLNPNGYLALSEWRLCFCPPLPSIAKLPSAPGVRWRSSPRQSTAF
jgi:hypothetical protein